MKTRRVGPEGPEIPWLGQGTWNMERDDRPGCLQALRRGLDLGLRHIDTAEMYGSGAVERLVGEAIRGRRDEVFLVSKVLPSNASKRGTIAACEASLKRLGTDRLDVYLLHWPGSHPIEATIEGFEALVAEGKILRWGLSNFDVDDLEAAQAVAPGKIACNQVLYHLEERAIEHRVTPWCQAHGVAVTAYSPFAVGRFPGPKSPGGRALAEVAERHGATSRQVALAFLAERAELVIPKASRAEHVEDNAGAARVELADADRRQIDAAFPLGKKCHLPML